MNSTKYVIFNSISAFVLAYAVYFHGLFNFLLAIDPTRVSFIILGIYTLLTIYLGIKRDKANLPLVKFVGNRLTAIGLAGTVIGIMLLLGDISVLNLTNINDVIGPLFTGMSTVFITTLFGIIFYLLVDFQIAYTFDHYNE